MNYTELLMKELERVTLRGNADKETVRRLGEIIYDLDQRVRRMEAQNKVTPVVKAEPSPPPVEEPNKEPAEEAPKPSPRRVTAPKNEEK